VSACTDTLGDLSLGLGGSIVAALIVALCCRPEAARAAE